MAVSHPTFQQTRQQKKKKKQKKKEKRKASTTFPLHFMMQMNPAVLLYL